MQIKWYHLSHTKFANIKKDIIQYHGGSEKSTLLGRNIICTFLESNLTIYINDFRNSLSNQQRCSQMVIYIDSLEFLIIDILGEGAGSKNLNFGFCKLMRL